LEKNQDKIHWTQLSGNPSAITLLEKNQDKIDWYYLSRNPSAITLLENNQDKIDWVLLSSNPSARAIALLEKNQDKINWDRLSENPSIFEYDYKGMKDAMYNGIKEDLVKNRFHPKNIPKFRDWGMDGFEDYEDDE
jgi:hypothetical protein